MRTLGIFRIKFKWFRGFCSVFRSLPQFAFCPHVNSSNSAFGFWSPIQKKKKNFDLSSSADLAPHRTPYVNLFRPFRFGMPPLFSFATLPHRNRCPRALLVYIKPSSTLPSLSVSVVLLPCLLSSTIHRAFIPHVLCLFLFLCRACLCTLIGIRTTHRASSVSICAIPRTYPATSLTRPPFGLRSAFFTSAEAVHIILIPSIFFFLSSHSPQSCSITSEAHILFHLTSTIISRFSIDFE
jgi:hypothetical protein